MKRGVAEWLRRQAIALVSISKRGFESHHRNLLYDSEGWAGCRPYDPEGDDSAAIGRQASAAKPIAAGALTRGVPSYPMMCRHASARPTRNPA
jgi:hypothetical protein